jgi:hypothetical protein
MAEVKRTLVIGASPRDRLPALVCEYTFRRASSVPFEVVHTFDREYGTSALLRRMNVTGFSYVRFAAPELAGHQGVAIYMDSDMIVFRDPLDLLKIPFGDAAVLRTRHQTSLLVYDCERLKHWKSEEILSRLEVGKHKYHELMDTLCEPKVAATIPVYWNHLDVYHRGTTGILHYSDITSQPWTWGRHDYGNFWYEALRDAVQDGAISRGEVAAAIREKHAAWWLDRKVFG